MLRNTDRILTTHQGVLPHAPDLKGAELTAAVKEVVQRQVSTGLDSINDGECSKFNFTSYARERLSGIQQLPEKPRTGRVPEGITGREMPEFGEFITTHDFFGKPLPLPIPEPPAQPMRFYLTEPMKYIGQAALKQDLENFKTALQGQTYAEAYIPAITPVSVSHWLRNDYFKTDEEFIHNLGEALHEEYKAITDAGFTLQLDVPNLPDGWQMYPWMSVADYRKHAEVRAEALNVALRDIPEEQIRVHICWGSGHHPHKHDLPLKDIVDIVFSIKGQAYSVEGANPAHEHEWEVFKDFKLPEGKVLIPGVVGHYTDYLEHPDLVAQRLVRFAGLVGRENVIAGTDCGLGPRVGHPNIAWAKLESLVEGARRASAQLWS